MPFGSALGAMTRYSPHQWNAVASVLGGPIFTNLASTLYSNKIQRDYYEYQKKGYERQLADFYKNEPGHQIRYPELSYQGNIRRMDLGISQSYASDARAVASAQRSIGFAVAGGLRSPYRSSRSLYGKSAGRSTRYL